MLNILTYGFLAVVFVHYFFVSSQKVIQTSNAFFQLLDEQTTNKLRYSGNLEDYLLESPENRLPPRSDHDGLGRGTKRVARAICAITDKLGNDIPGDWAQRCSE